MARKNKGLPFVVQPRLQPVTELLGTEASGQIEIVRRGYLTVSEKSIVQGSMAGNPLLTKAFVTAKAIGAQVGRTAQQVFDDIAADEQPEYLEEHREEVSKMMTAMLNHEEKLRLVATTAMIMSRVNPEWDPSDTVDLHPDLQDALYSLYSDEERKCVEALEEAAAESDKAQEGSEGKD